MTLSVELPVATLALAVSAALYLATLPTSVTASETPRCGEAALISVTVLDSAGQPVSDHTLVEFVSNFGTVLAGTALSAGGTTPLSNAVETFGGVASVYLLTRSDNPGPYEVLAAALVRSRRYLTYRVPLAHISLQCDLPPDWTL